jgi:hypothetical protein
MRRGGNFILTKSSRMSLSFFFLAKVSARDDYWARGRPLDTSFIFTIKCGCDRGTSCGRSASKGPRSPFDLSSYILLSSAEPDLAPAPTEPFEPSRTAPAQQEKPLVAAGFRGHATLAGDVSISRLSGAAQLPKHSKSNLHRLNITVLRPSSNTAGRIL